MTKTKSTKRALLMSGLALLMCVSMLIGSTFAWFTDSVTSAGNKIQAGTLKLDLELLDKDGNWNSIKEEKTALFDYEKWEPGYVDVKILKVENEGNLALKWYAKFVSENDLSILADVIDVYVKPSEDAPLTYPADRNLDGYTKVGTVAEFVNTIESTTYGALKAGEAAYLGIALKMQESAGNTYQGLELGAFDIMLLATQDTVESDSFNNQYDRYSGYENVVTVDSMSGNNPNALFNMSEDVLAYLPAGETDASQITLNGAGETESSLAIVGNNTKFTGDLNISAHSNINFSDSSELVIDGITVDGVLKVHCFKIKNVIIRNVKADSISVYATGNTTIENCEIDSAEENGIFVTAYAEDYNLTITNNVIKNSAKNAIQIAGSASGTTFGAGTFVVEGNTFENWCTVNDKPRAAFKVWGDSELAPVDITGNANGLTSAASALAITVNENNTFVSTAGNTNQVEFDFYGYTFDVE